MNRINAMGHSFMIIHIWRAPQFLSAAAFTPELGSDHWYWSAWLHISSSVINFGYLANTDLVFVSSIFVPARMLTAYYHCGVFLMVDRCKVNSQQQGMCPNGFGGQHDWRRRMWLSSVLLGLLGHFSNIVITDNNHMLCDQLATWNTYHRAPFIS